MLRRDAKETKKLMQVAQGEAPADLAVLGGKVLNVYTAEVMENISVCTSGPWIAYIGDDPHRSIGPKTEVIDAGGKTVIPGFVDGHTHLANLTVPATFLAKAMVGGTTTIVTETMEPYPVAGLAGLIDFLESLKNQPVKILATAPSMGSISKAARGIAEEDLNALLGREEIIGLGESYWQGVLQDPEVYLSALCTTLSRRKTLEGHTAGASGRKLMAYLGAGITSCHEPIRVQEVVERLRMGLHVMIREGGVRRDLDEISKIKETGVDLRRLILVSDSLGPNDLLEKGYMEFIVQKAIDCGFGPIDAIRMATLNPAEHFRMDDLVGGLAPGRYADMVILPDLGTIQAKCVISNGRIIARDGRLVVAPRAHAFTRETRQSIRLTRRLEPQDFGITAPEGIEKARTRVIGMVTGLVTREVILEIPVIDGEIRVDPGHDIVKVAAVDRAISPGTLFTGLIQGFGLRSGAMACSAAWDAADIVVVGADEGDMALAVNRIWELQGGAVICRDGKVLEEYPMPVFGILSELPLEEAGRQIRKLCNAAKGLGIPFADPILSLITLTGAAIPFLRICEEGLVNLKDGKPVGLFV